MPVTAARARKLLLGLGNVSEAPHFDRIAFRTPRRIFATLAGTGVDVNFMFDAFQQETFCEMAPAALAPHPGGWGRMGATRCDLKKVDEATFTAAAMAAHERASAPPPARRRSQRAPAPAGAAPERQLAGFVAKFSPSHRRLVRALRAAARATLPGANELVYDNYNFLVLAYSPTEKPSDSYFSIGFDKNGASLFFGYNGTTLPDPKRLLHGKGARNRFVRLESVSTFRDPDVAALVEASVAASKPMGGGKGRLVIRAASPKQRPRR
ncbi:MAG TPA: hypothetical protein VHH90_08460 [Polyangia bacterium]|nr:hypothetical protein [Polyangia bacterium]